MSYSPLLASGIEGKVRVENKAELETFGTMVAAHRTRRKTQLPKRRKQIASKKTQRRKLLPKLRKPQLKRRKPQLKQRKPQLKRRKPQLKRGKPQLKREKHPVHPKPVPKRPYDEFISKVLRQLNQDKVCISSKAKGKMISFIRKFYNNVSEQAKHNKKSKDISIIGTKELQKALKRVMHKDQAMKLVRTIRKVSRHRCR
uniref:Uncharacterized protein n=1 Tax=Sphaerodactylus townsendi TaxID=933632 RepID=A0ACB8EFV5_9SAUR